MNAIKKAKEFSEYFDKGKIVYRNLENYRFLCKIQKSLYEYFKKCNEHTKNVFSLEKLIQIFKGTLVIESTILDRPATYGSVSSLDNIYKCIASINYTEAERIRCLMIKLFGIDLYSAVTRDGILNELTLVIEFSNNEKAKIKAENIYNTYWEAQSRINLEQKINYIRAQKRKKLTKIFKLNDKIDRKKGIREKLKEKLNSLTIEEKLYMLANDKRHSPKFYPKNIIGETTIDILKNIDKDLQKKLLNKFEIYLRRRSPWRRFKKMLYEATGQRYNNKVYNNIILESSFPYEVNCEEVLENYLTNKTDSSK